MNLYSIKEAAKILGYKEGSLRNKLYNGTIESVRIGRMVKITKKQIEDFTGMKIVDGQLVEYKEEK